MREAGHRPARWCRNRLEVWDSIGAKVANERVLSLEFGVYKGEATRYWSKLLKHED